VGEIYDEGTFLPDVKIFIDFVKLLDVSHFYLFHLSGADDEDEFDFSEDSITVQEDGSFIIRGDANLGDCDTVLDLKLDEEEALKEFATLSGFLCMCAGEIPHVGDFVMSRGWCFEIMHADDKKILQVKVDRLVGSFDEEDDEDEFNDNPLRGFLKRSLGGEQDGDDNVDISEAIDDQLKKTRIRNSETAREVERMVASSSEKRIYVENELDGDKK
jgi:hypothetical protein